METFIGLIFCLILVAAIIVMRIIQKKTLRTIAKELSDPINSYTFVVKNEEGKEHVVLGIVVNAGEAISSFTEQDWNVQSFTVKMNGTDRALTVEEAYPCDINGNEADSKEATHIALELTKEDTQLIAPAPETACIISHPKFSSDITLRNPNIEC